MSEKLEIWWKKVKVLLSEIFHWIYPYHIFEEEPMEFRFVNIRRPKVRYDIALTQMKTQQCTQLLLTLAVQQL